ncbi:MAG: protein BatD, partial [Sphingobacteriales bacterium]
MKIKHYILWVLVFWSTALLAQDISFTASVSKNPVAVGEQFEVTFTLNGNAESFDPPSFNGFQVLSGPNQSTSMTSINGRTTMSLSLSYILAGTKEGSFTITAASVTAGGKQYKSNPIKIKVAKGSAAAPNN